MASQNDSARLGCCPSCGTPTLAAQPVTRGFFGYTEDFDILCQIICVECGSHLLAEESVGEDKTADRLAWRVKPNDGITYHPPPTDRPN